MCGGTICDAKFWPSGEKYCTKSQFEWEILNYIFPSPSRTTEPHQCLILLNLIINHKHSNHIGSFRIGSSGRVGGGARNMKSMWPPLAAIFFMTYLYRAWGGHGPLGTLPGSATELTMLGIAHKVHPPPFYADFAQEFVHP